ncbi:hypothetical protein [Vibrio owensii]|uniref:hypothetical protein n=1 Tax=Vibrio harveyi group TaxID=717610 RepID=UPI003CC57392
MILSQQTHLTNIHQMDNSFTASVFMSRQREAMPLRNALIHLELIKDIDRSELSIFESISEAIKPVSDGTYKVSFKDVKNTGIRTYLVELGRGITLRSGAMIASGYFNESIRGRTLEKESVYLLNNSHITPDMASRILSTSIAKEMISTLKSMSNNDDILREAERHATSAILDIPNGERLIRSQASSELSA